MILFARPLEAPDIEANPLVPLTVHLLALTEIDQYPLRSGQHVNQIAERLRLGHKCFVVRDSTSIVHTNWIGIGVATIEYLGWEVKLAQEVAYSYGSYTLHRLRKLDVASVRAREMMRQLRDMGFRRVIAAVVPENVAAVHAVEKFGYRPLGVIGFVKIGPWRHDYCRVQGDPGFTIKRIGPN